MAMEYPLRLSKIDVLEIISCGLCSVNTLLELPEQISQNHWQRAGLIAWSWGGGTLTGDVEGRAVIDRRSEDGESCCDRDRAVKIKGLRGDMTLVVV